MVVAMTAQEKFFLFVSTYIMVLQVRNMSSAFSKARQVPASLVTECNAEARAYDFARWMAGDVDRPEWMPKTVEEAEAAIRASTFVSNGEPKFMGDPKLMAICPFHGGGAENTSSMEISMKKGSYFCFTCKASGALGRGFNFDEESRA